MYEPYSSGRTAHAEVPEGLKNNVRAVLLSKIGGVLMHQFLRDYAELVKESLDFQAQGFQTLESFIRSIPDTARMEYSPKDGTMRIFGIAKANTYMNKVTKKAQGQIPASHLREIDNHISAARRTDDSSMKGESVNIKTEPGLENRVCDVDVSTLVPDERGWYSLCFPAGNEPEVQSLDEMFSQAGPLMAVHRAAGLIFVRYDSPESVQKAFQLFGFLNLRIAHNRRSKDPASSNKRQYSSPHSEEGKKSYKFKADQSRERTAQPHGAQNTQGEERGYSEHSAIGSPPPLSCSPVNVSSSEVSDHGNGDQDGFSTELFVGNIPNDRECTREMVKKLFSPYKLVHLYWKRSKRKTFAFALLPNREDAIGAQQKLDGYNLMGRPLKVRMSDVRVTNRVGEFKSSPREPKGKLFDHLPEHDLMPDLEEDMPDLEEDFSDLESSVSGVTSLRQRSDIVPNPEITRQVIAGSGGDLRLQITRRVDDRFDERSSRMSEVIGRTISDIRDCGSSGVSLRSQTEEQDKELKGMELEEPCILVANFNKETTKEELRALFFRYHPKNVEIVSSLKCTKAFIMLATVADVRAAVSEMNQEVYMGQRLLVDVPFHCPGLRFAVLGPDAAGRKVVEKLSPSEQLKEHSKILKVLRAAEPRLHLGQRIEVLVTSVVSDNFFWGQIADREAATRLSQIMAEINKPGKIPEKAGGLGQCKAIFDVDRKWYRAWILRTSGAQAQVFFVDYGNIALIPWNQTGRLTDAKFWDLRPMATPFMLVDKILNLKEKELTLITVEVAALEDPLEGNCIIAKPISLIANLPLLE